MSDGTDTGGAERPTRARKPRLQLAREARPSYEAMRALEASLASCGVDRTVTLLVQIRVSQVNGCAFCIDMHIKEALAAGETLQRCYGLDAWRDTGYYTEPERAALDLAEAMTVLRPGGVPDPIWDAAERHFASRQLAGLVMIIVSMNAWNRMAITTRAPAPGSYRGAR